MAETQEKLENIQQETMFKESEVEKKAESPTSKTKTRSTKKEPAATLETETLKEALEKANAEVISKLRFAPKEEIYEDQIKKQRLAFMQAMVAVHKEMPVIKSNKRIIKDEDGKEYCYADLNSIVELTRPLLAKHGLYVEFRQSTDIQNKVVSVTCFVHHQDGYSYKGDTIRVYADMNNIQKIGSIITYIKRYAYTSMFNLTTDTDDDGIAAVNPNNKMLPKEPVAKANTQEQPQEQPKVQPKVEPKTELKVVKQEPFKFHTGYKEPQKQQTEPQKKVITPEPQVFPTGEKHKCSDCGADISENEFKYSIRNFGKAYCIACQQKHN